MKAQTEARHELGFFGQPILQKQNLPTQTSTHRFCLLFGNQKERGGMDLPQLI